ncbi:MAG: hypothetical protein RR704_14990 [Stenotrophomonas sp.]
MVGLYLFVRTALPVMLGGAVAIVASRVITSRLARLPTRQMPLPERSLLPGAAAQRRYRRLRRRRPNLTSMTVPPKVPRTWLAIALAAMIGAVTLAVCVMPNGARFQVMVESVMGYPATVIEAQLPPAQQQQMLDAWTPVLQQAARPVTMRYRQTRTGPLVDVHDVIPVQVRRQGQVLQMATARPMDAAMLREALRACGGPQDVPLNIHVRTLAPWRERGWQAWHPEPMP